jgi:hypothetical protein
MFDCATVFRWLGVAAEQPHATVAAVCRIKEARKFNRRCTQMQRAASKSVGNSLDLGAGLAEVGRPTNRYGGVRTNDSAVIRHSDACCATASPHLHNSCANPDVDLLEKPRAHLRASACTCGRNSLRSLICFRPRVQETNCASRCSTSADGSRLVAQISSAWAHERASPPDLTAKQPAHRHTLSQC